MEELLQMLREKHQEAEEIDEKIRIVEQNIAELEVFSNNLIFLNNNEKEIIAPIGKGVYVKADMREMDFFIEVGAGILTKKTLEETKGVIESQVKKLGDIKVQLFSDKEETQVMLQGLLNKFEEKNNS